MAKLSGQSCGDFQPGGCLFIHTTAIWRPPKHLSTSDRPNKQAPGKADQSICDRIWQKLASPHIMARLTFYHHLMSTSMNKQSMGISLPLFPWSAFPGACFLGLPDMLDCSGGLQMAVVWIDKHPPSWKSLHDWPESLAIKLATICDICSSNRPQVRPSSSQLQHVEKLTTSMAPHHPWPPPLYDHLW